MRGYFGIGAEDLDNKDGTRDLANEEVTVTAAPVRGDFKEGYDVGLDNDQPKKIVRTVIGMSNPPNPNRSRSPRRSPRKRWGSRSRSARRR